jgi:hypothetical protein
MASNLPRNSRYSFEMVGFRDFNETFEADSMVSLRPRKPVHIVAVYYIDLSTICRVVYPD